MTDAPGINPKDLTHADLMAVADQAIDPTDGDARHT